jgi:NAD(P)H dehydrogenase (quinone)
MTIAIFGATGKVGGDVLDHLLTRGAEAGGVLALVRKTDRLAELAERGFRTAQVDLDQPDGIAEALQGVEKVLLISTGMPGQRLPQHQAAVDGVKAAAVRHLVYTSALQAATTSFVLADEHKKTEEYITAAGVPATFLRNGWYTENHQADFAAAQRGVIANSVGAGRIASAPRREFGEATAVVLTTPGH